MNEETMQNLRNNIIKDHRRRYLFVDKKKQEGLQVMPADMKKVAMYSARSLYALMTFLVLFGIFKLRFVLAITAAAVTYGALELYFRFIFLKNLNSVKIRDEEFAIFDSIEAHEDNKSDAFIRIFLPLLIMLVVFSVIFDPQVNDNPIDMNLMKLAIVILPVYAAQNSVKYLHERKILNAMKPAKVKKEKKSKKK